MESKTTLVLGASDNPMRYSYLAIESLKKRGHPVRATGKKKTVAHEVDISPEQVNWDDIDTITLYLNPLHQQQYYNYILSLSPKRIIFNPGAENPELASLARKNGIQPIEACTLVLLSTGQY
jgi:predicted CoA-binding protein